MRQLILLSVHLSICFGYHKYLSSKRFTNSLLRSTTTDYALLFDCDGVIVETEELHRLAYNKAFNKCGLRLPDGRAVEWDVPYYDILQNTGC